jgi:hypothetical protein
MTRNTPNTPKPEAIVIKMSTLKRLVVQGEGELPVGVPARNQGAVVAIDPHQSAAAPVMRGMHSPTTTARDPPTLS